MTVDPNLGEQMSPSGCQETDVYANAQKIFYPTNIEISHLQLRHLISSPSLNLVYFVNGKKVYCLDTVTKRKINVTELPFEPVCTASGHGWFCAGGQTLGYFAAIPMSGTSRRHPTMLDHLDPFSRMLPPRIRVERLGEQIVNSISIHKLRGIGEESEDEVVAVLTNNDHTVRIYSLTRDVEIRAEAFDFPMNHATISPDGKILMIVGDKELAYFYKSLDLPEDETTKSNTAGEVRRAPWVFLRELRLHKPDDAPHAAYFTTAWSPNGKFCATASENGYITVLDTFALSDLDTDPTMTIVPSSRPHTGAGSVRSMCFSPDPWDLLLWTEDHGRMCIGDMRSGLRRRQVIRLDPKAETVTKVKLLESSLINEESVIADLSPELELRRTVASTDPRNASAGRRRRPEYDSRGLTEEEQQILDGLRTSRQQDETSPQGSTLNGLASTPRTINYGTPPHRRRTPAQGAAVLGSIRDYLREHNYEGYRQDTEGSSARTSQIGTQASANSVAGTTRTSTPRIAAPADRTNPDPWRVIEAAMQRAAPASSTNPASTANDTDEVTDDDYDIPLPPLINSADEPSPRTRTTLPNIRDISDNLRQEVSAERRRRMAQDMWTSEPGVTWRDYRERLAELDRRGGGTQSASTTEPDRSDAALRLRLAELEAELEAAERRRVTNADLILAAENEAADIQRRLGDSANRSAAADREFTERRRRLLALATHHAEVDAERRRRLRDARSMVAGVPTSPRRDTSLTTRGEAVLAREQRERERSGASPRGSGDGLVAAYEHSMQAIRRMHRGGEGHGRGAGSARALGAVGDSERGLGTTGIAWGSGRVVYVGTQEGIFELTMNFDDRKFWPAVEMR